MNNGGRILICSVIFFFFLPQHPWIKTSSLQNNSTELDRFRNLGPHEGERGQAFLNGGWLVLSHLSNVALSTQYDLITLVVKQLARTLSREFLTTKQVDRDDYSGDWLKWWQIAKESLLNIKVGERARHNNQPCASGHLYNNRVISEMKAIMWLNKSMQDRGKCYKS